MTMSSNKNKTPEKQLKTIKIWKRIVTTFEVIFGIILIAAMVILFVPNVKAEIIKGMAIAATIIAVCFVTKQAVHQKKKEQGTINCFTAVYVND